MSYEEWLEYPCTPDKYCSDCDDKQAILDDTIEFMEEIVKQLYSKERLDTNILDHCIENLCYKLNVKPASGQLQIMRKRSAMYLISDLIEEQPEFLKSLKAN